MASSMRKVYALMFARDLCAAWPKAAPEDIADEAVRRAVALEGALERQEELDERHAKNLARSQGRAA